MALLTVRAFQDEPIDALVWRALGAGSGAVEQVLELNPGLAQLGPLLPENHPVLIPQAAPTQPVADLVQLWN